MSRRILITGASVAGNMVAWWLGRAGFEVTVVERSPEFRDGGQTIDVRGPSREVLRRMGLEQTALEQGTGEEGTAWVDEDGKVAAQFLTAATGGDRPTADMEVLRGDLAWLLYGPARQHATYRFDDSVKRVDQDDHGAAVTFSSGIAQRYEAVIVAESVGSKTREMVFPGNNEPRWMGLAIAYFTIPRKTDDDRLWRWYSAPSRRSISLRPDRCGTARAMLSVQQPPAGEQDWDVARQKAWMRERFADAGWQSDRVLAGIQTTNDFYFDVLRQVRLPRWSKGCVVLTGDAAWCATPMAGYGTTLAVTGGYVLARELIRPAEVEPALTAYEQAMRPIIEEAQGVPKIAPRLANPHSRLGIRLLHAALSVARRPAVRGVTGKLVRGRSKDVDLARYGPPTSGGMRVAERSRPGGLTPILALGTIGVVLGASALVGRRHAPDPSHPGIRRQYRGQDRLGNTPPDAAFGAVWPVLQTGLAVGGYRLLRQPSSTARDAAVGLWLLNIAMVAGWTQLIFREKHAGAGGVRRGSHHRRRLRRCRRQGRQAGGRRGGTVCRLARLRDASGRAHLARQSGRGSMRQATTWHDIASSLSRREIALMIRLDTRGTVRFADANGSGTCSVDRPDLLARFLRLRSRLQRSSSRRKVRV